MSTHYKNLLILFFFTFLTYTPILFNYWVGDDYLIIERNTFYASWKNVPRLFEKGYITNVQAVEYVSDPQYDYGTGSVSYRPVSNFSYFFDYFLFQAKPYGSHLIDILIHCANSFFVYWIVVQLFSSSILGLFAGLLFSLHPLQSEAVAVMSYRADIIAAFFVLYSFYFWVKFQQGEYLRKGYYGGALLMYFLAVFSKESAIMLPLVILLFDQLLAIPRLSLIRRMKYYAGFILILIVYLYLYIIVFPNSSVSFHWLGASGLSHCLIMGHIWSAYLINVLLPWTVRLIPGLYCPPAPLLISLETLSMGAVLIVLIAGACFLWRKYKPVAFLLFWYILFYIPVSNVIPIANPMAYRFMYLPSIGLFIVLAWIFHKVFISESLEKYSKRLSVIFHAAIIIICIICTLFINGNWKSDFNVGYTWAKDYPALYRGYALLGQAYFDVAQFKEAERYLEKSVRLRDRIPADLLMLAQCYRVLGEMKEAEALLKQIISLYPVYADPYFELAAIYYYQNNIPLEHEMIKKGLSLNPRKSLAYFENLHQLKR